MSSGSEQFALFSAVNACLFKPADFYDTLKTAQHVSVDHFFETLAAFELSITVLKNARCDNLVCDNLCTGARCQAPILELAAATQIFEDASGWVDNPETYALVYQDLALHKQIRQFLNRLDRFTTLEALTEVFNMPTQLSAPAIQQIVAELLAEKEYLKIQLLYASPALLEAIQLGLVQTTQQVDQLLQELGRLLSSHSRRL